MMASAQVVETSVNTNNSPSQDYTTNPDDHSNHNRICMESLDLIYKLIALKIKSKALVRIDFMSQVFQEHSHCYDKRKK